MRLFVTIVRFDPVYVGMYQLQSNGIEKRDALNRHFVGHFKCNKKRIIDYPNLWGWVRDVYQWPGVKDTVNMHHIKEHYHGSHPSVSLPFKVPPWFCCFLTVVLPLQINPHGIVPLGPEIDFETPHGREKLFH